MPTGDIVEPKRVENEEEQSNQDRELSNRDVKNDPLFLKLTSELAEFKRADDERKEVAEKAARDAEFEKAKSAEKFEDALKLKEAEFESERTKHYSEIQQRDLATALMVKGFDVRSVKLLTSEYDAENSGTPDEYATACFEDESNARFLQKSDPNVPNPPPKVTGGSGGLLDIPTLKAYEHSDDPEKRKIARANLKAYRKKTGKYPY